MTRRQALQTRPESATRVSHRAANLPEKAVFYRLARGSLLGVSLMILASSCIVADPPEYTDPVQTRPELAAYGAKPAIYQAVVITTPSATSPVFQVPVRSEDAGEILLANFWRDYGTPSQTFINTQFVAASTYNDTADRDISFTWTTGANDAGCHTVSIVVAHFGSYATAQVLDPVKGAKDAAIVTWWVNVNPTAPQSTLVGCPNQQSTTL